MNSPKTPRYLKLEPNQVYTVSRKAVDPVECRGFGSKQLRWILTNGLALYTPVALRSEIERFGIGVPFTIEKSVVSGRNQWIIRAAQQQPVAAILANAGPLDSPVPEPNEDDDPPPIPLTKLEQALKSAVRAASVAEKHAASLGYSCRFSSDDVSKMAIALFELRAA